MQKKKKKVHKNLRDWYLVIGLTNDIFSIMILEKSQLQFAFMCKGSQFTFTILHRIIWIHQLLSSFYYKGFELNAGPQRDNSLYFDAIMIILETEEQWRIDLSEIMTHMTNRGWLISLVKIQELAKMVKFLE